MNANIDILKDFADLQATVHQLGESNKKFVSENIKLKERNERLRKALVGLIGAETKEDLEAMEVAMRMMPGVEADKIVAINAIHALLHEGSVQSQEGRGGVDRMDNTTGLETTPQSFL